MLAESHAGICSYRVLCCYLEDSDLEFLNTLPQSSIPKKVALATLESGSNAIFDFSCAGTLSVIIRSMPGLRFRYKYPAISTSFDYEFLWPDEPPKRYVRGYTHATGHTGPDEPKTHITHTGPSS